VSCFGKAYGVTSECLARRLNLTPAVLTAYDVENCPPRWLALALAGVGIAIGVPPSELNWLLTDAQPDATRADLGENAPDASTSVEPPAV